MSAMVYCPFPDHEAARRASNTLLDKKLIACANIIGETESIYDWKGERSTDHEVAVLFKTSKERLSDTVGCLAQIHPYDAPAIIGWHCDALSEATGAWIEEVTLGS
ncbi:divalent-cation tolerance protein CutA [Altererythrobacter sp.]|uniref:divalent-cation tolerance protein CutA n=1 Tax=Altererythrobacter sp. TaxID=1872480 RepID=UPI001B1FA985|nr:divalent-cation tolerance protein CutA [Altererythrobacter sp.]MBO6609426.1 divalent-cation tolerance protein CutA [Altererythrobacter sp.]MBO6642293.1 divalent-cation tolerance protein CutA [Altererythrobacter sp.]MBO6709199.1 divalent-cation tolerance protein CutA [Altererythrobacter sp.]